MFEEFESNVANGGKYSAKNHLRTMHEELVYIREKTSDLSKFIENEKLFHERIRDLKQRRLAIRQLNAMTDYCICLTKRIEYFEKNGRDKDNKQE